MNIRKILFMYIIFTTTYFAQTDSSNTKLNSEEKKEKYINSFVGFGMGITGENLNFGGDLFFPLSEKYLLGLRGNINSEIDVFSDEKLPKENLFDLDISLRHTSYMSNRFVIFIGVGIGYSNGRRRGKFLRRPNPLLPVEEYETIKFNSISALAEIETGIFLTRSFGISLKGYSVFTSDKNIYGYQIGIFIYRLSN